MGNYAVTMEIGGRARRIRFDMNALSDLEGALGKSVADILGGDGRALGFSAIRALVWAGLRHEDRGLTLERAGSMIQSALEGGMSLADVLAKVSEAIAACGVFSSEKASDAPSDPPATA